MYELMAHLEPFYSACTYFNVQRGFVRSVLWSVNSDFSSYYYSILPLGCRVVLQKTSAIIVNSD